MSSLVDRLRLLEDDLMSVPPRISVYGDLPFAVFRYIPDEEWGIRREVNLLSTRMNQAGRTTSVVSLSALLWQAIRECEGVDAVVELEKQRGFLAAQDQITTYLSDSDWRPLANLLQEQLDALTSSSFVFLIRAAAMAPGLYHMSKLLDQMQGRTDKYSILFYPGSIEGTTGLRFMALKDREALGNYRVKIYG